MSAPGDGIDWLEMGYEHGYKGGTTPRVFPNRIAEEKYWDGYENGSEAYEYEHEEDCSAEDYTDTDNVWTLLPHGSIMSARQWDYMHAAALIYETDENVSIDAEVEETDGGMFVRAWVFISEDEMQAYRHPAGQPDEAQEWHDYDPDC
jgi:hypothetical protein